MATQKILFRKNPLKMFACCCRCQCWNVRRSPTWNGFILAYDDFIFKRTKVVSQHECMGWRAFNIARVCVSRIFDVWCRFVPSSPPTFWTFFRSMLMAIWTLELSIQFFIRRISLKYTKKCVAFNVSSIQFSVWLFLAGHLNPKNGEFLKLDQQKSCSIVSTGLMWLKLSIMLYDEHCRSRCCYV